MTGDFLSNPGDLILPEGLNPQDIVEVEFRGNPNSFLLEDDPAENWYWLHDGSDTDILRYKIVERNYE